MPQPRVKLERYRFGWLQVVRFVEMRDRHAWFEAKCDCGTLVIVRGADLIANTRRKCSPTCTWVKPKFYAVFSTIEDGTRK
jgi:hypothetical protein